MSWTAALGEVGEGTSILGHPTTGYASAWNPCRDE